MNQQPTPDPRASLIDACAHLDRAAQLLGAAHRDDPFHPALTLAAQISLLAAALHPGICAAEHPDDDWTAAQHLDRALALLDAVPADQVSADQHHWRVELAGLRDRVHDAVAGSDARGGAR